MSAQLTPRKLLELLRAVPESALDVPMGAYYDCRCAWGHLSDTDELLVETKDGSPRVMLIVD